MIPFHHAAAYGFNAMFQWTDRYRAVSTPNYDQLGSLAYYILLFLRQMTGFAIPIFLLVSGFFVAFAAMSKSPDALWGNALTRIKKLIWPFLIWTVFVFLLIRNIRPTLQDILSMYYYIPLICQYYLLSPLLSPLAKKHTKWLLLISAIVQFSITLLGYLSVLDYPWASNIKGYVPLWFFPSRIFYFSLGLVTGFHRAQVYSWLYKHKRKLFVIMITLIVITIPEYELLSQLAGKDWLGAGFSTISRTFLALTLALCLLAFDNLQIPFSGWISSLGSRSLGIYLANTPAIFLAGALMYYLTPGVLGMQLLYQLVLIAFGLGIPLLLMSFIKRSPARIIYPYLFG
jgi:peptidoglycan/LPS O-acetylase OafA/YrhL